MLVVMLTLALGTGVNTAIFGVIDAVLLRPLAFPNSDHIVQIGEENGKNSPMGLPYKNFVDLRERGRSFSAIAGSWNYSVH